LKAALLIEALYQRGGSDGLCPYNEGWRACHRFDVIPQEIPQLTGTWRPVESRAEKKD